MHEKNRQLNVTKDPQNLSAPQTQPLSLIARFKNFNSIKVQYQLIHEFFGFDIHTVSRKNLKAMRNCLRRGNDGVTAHLVNSIDPSLLSNLAFSNELSEVEIIIFNALLNSYSLKHATAAMNEIRKTGRMQAIHSLETSSHSGNRNTSSKSGKDRSIFFVFGIGNHKIPEFLKRSPYIITINLAKMEKQDPLTTARLWVSGHLSEYEKQNQYAVKLGNVLFVTKHFRDYTKIYQFIYDNGLKLEWKIQYQDEIFAAQDVAPGVALQFIYMLRLLGGQQNLLLNKLYQAASAQVNFMPILEKVFTSVMLGFVYPEAKIIDDLDINREYISIQDNNNPPIDSLQNDAVKNAVREGNSQLLLALFKKGYSFYCKNENLLKIAIEKTNDNDIRFNIMRILIKEGLSKVQLSSTKETAMESATQYGTAADLNFLLSQEYTGLEEPLIKYIPNLSSKCSNGFNDIIEIE